MMFYFRPLPIPPYPGVIPYTVDQAGEASKGSSGGPEELGSSPRLLGIEHRPVSVGSFGPPSTGTVPGLRTGTLSEEQVRDKFYAYWTRQKVSYHREMDVLHTLRTLQQFSYVLSGRAELGAV